MEKEYIVCYQKMICSCFENKHESLVSLTKRYTLVDETNFMGIFNWLLEDEYADNPVVWESLEVEQVTNEMTNDAFKKISLNW